VAAIYAGTQGHLDKVPVARVQEWEAGFARFLTGERPTLLAEIESKQALDDKLFERLKAAVSTYNHQFGVDGYVDVADPGPSAETKAAPKTASSAEDKPKAAHKPKPATRKKPK
jgi:hypothetical protein